MKYFTTCQTLDELKKEFRRLAMLHHRNASRLLSLEAFRFLIFKCLLKVIGKKLDDSVFLFRCSCCKCFLQVPQRHADKRFELRVTHSHYIHPLSFCA